MAFKYSTFALHTLILNILLIPNRLGLKKICYIFYYKRIIILYKFNYVIVLIILNYVLLYYVKLLNRAQPVNK